MLPRSLSAAAQSRASKPRLASLVGAFFAMWSPVPSKGCSNGQGCNGCLIWRVRQCRAFIAPYPAAAGALAAEARARLEARPQAV